MKCWWLNLHAIILDVYQMVLILSSKTDYHIYQISWGNTENNPESKDWEDTQTSKLAIFVSCLSTESPILIGKLQQKN